MQISWLPEPEEHPLWNEIRALLKPAADLGDVEIYQPCDWVWIMFDGPTLYAAATTRLWEGEEAELRLAGGFEHHKWARLLDETVSDWARQGGAVRLTSRGRKGWARLARAWGWDALGKDDAGRDMFEKGL